MRVYTYHHYTHMDTTSTPYVSVEMVINKSTNQISHFCDNIMVYGDVGVLFIIYYEVDSKDLTGNEGRGRWDPRQT